LTSKGISASHTPQHETTICSISHGKSQRTKIVCVAQGLFALGFRPGDRLAILAENDPEWAIIDLACLYLGGVDVPLYLTSPITEGKYDGCYSVRYDLC
jgi:acyl-CoA synthetase (AMP-forming)/AMP-acid ligase II